MTADRHRITPEVAAPDPAVRPGRRRWRTGGVAVVMVLVFAAGYATHTVTNESLPSMAHIPWPKKSPIAPMDSRM